MIKLLFANWIGASKEECHEVAHELERILSHRQKTYSIRIERHLCGRVHKKGAGIALTSLAASGCNGSGSAPTGGWLWGGQSWPQPPFRRPSRLKAGCGQNCPPHNSWRNRWS